MLIEALDKVRWAVSRTPLVIEHGYYRIEGSYIHAADGELTAAAPFPDDRVYMVPAGAFDAALRRLPGDGRIELKHDVARISHGRYRAQVPVIVNMEHAGSYLRHPDKLDMQAFEPGPDFAAKLARLQPFIAGKGAQPWAQAVGFNRGCMFATNNATLCMITDTGLPEALEITLPVRAVEYITRRTEIMKKIYVDPDKSAMAFRWEDGSWMRAHLMATPFPPSAYAMVESAPQPDWEIPDEWRTVVGDAVSFAGNGEYDSIVELHRDFVVARNKDATLEVALCSPVPAFETCTKWKAKFLQLVLGVATHFDLTQYPNPCAFAGDDCAGLIMGCK